jgi:hypothetical protein
MIQRINKYFWSLANNSLLIFTLALFFIISTIQVNGAKEQFETTKPHVNTGAVDSTTESYKYTIQRNESVFNLTGPKDLGGHRLAISIAGSDLLPIKQVSRDLFKSTRSYSSGNFVFELDGGGSFYPWINEFFVAKSTPKTVKIYLLTKNNKEKKVRKFYDAIITEVKFPTLDRSSRKSGYLTVKVKTEREHFAKVKNVKHKLGTGPKLWSPSNFSLVIDGLHCKHVSKIDGFSIKQKVKGTAELSDLSLTISMRDWEAWNKRYNAIKGIEKTSNEISGSITFLGPDMKTELSAINISGVRLVSLTKKKGGRFFEAVLSVNKMNFKTF